MSEKTEVIQRTEDTPAKESATPAENNVNSSAPVRLFGQFKSSGTGFGSFGQSASNGDNSSTSLFTSTLSKLSSANSSGGFASLATNGSSGFGSASTSLAASLAPLSSNKTLFGETSKTKPKEDETKKNGEEDNGEEEKEDDDNDDGVDEDGEEGNKNAPSLFETAAEYEAKRASTHPAANIQGDTSTGEEHEVTKFQMAGKLFMYNPEQQQFVERGYGILKINESHDPSDWHKLQARIIMRLDKAFRVILNSPIFPKMTVERATDRSVRFGAQDESHLRVFVIKASPSDCSNLMRELQSRLDIIERQQTSPIKDPSEENLTARIRKRSHSKSDSDTSETNNDLSKKSKLIQENQDTTDEDSVESIKTGEQATSD